MDLKRVILYLALIVLLIVSLLSSQWFKSKKPEMSKFFIQKGTWFNDKDLHETAEAYQTIAIWLNPKSQWAYNCRGLAKYRQRKYDAALTDLNRALLLSPCYPAALYNKGLTYKAKGDYHKALESFEKIKTCYQPNLEQMSNAYYEIAWILSKQKHYQESIDNFKLMLELDLKSSKAYFGIAYNQNDLKQYKEAKKNYQKYIEIAGPRVDGYINLSDVCFSLKEYKEGAAYAQKALEKNNRSSYAYLNLARNQYMMGEFQETLDNADEAIKYYNNFADAYYWRGLAKAALKDKSGAKSDFEKAISVEKDNRNNFIPDLDEKCKQELKKLQ